MAKKSTANEATGFNDLEKLSRNEQHILKGIREAIETSEPKTRRHSARKRKSDDLDHMNFDEWATSAQDFACDDRNAKPTILNSRDAFFDKKNSRGSQPTDSPIKIAINEEQVIKTSKSFFDDDDRLQHEARNGHSPHRSPTNFGHDLYKRPSYVSSSTGTPCGVVDELFTGLYGCMPSWECSLPWTEDTIDISDDEEYQNYSMARRDMTRQDANAIREHLSFPKQLGKEFISHSEQRNRERNNITLHRTIRRSPSSRLTTLESDSRQKMPGSKMFRRTDIDRVTEIHWDEEVLDTKTLEDMAKLAIF